MPSSVGPLVSLALVVAIVIATALALAAAARWLERARAARSGAGLAVRAAPGTYLVLHLSLTLAAGIAIARVLGEPLRALLAHESVMAFDLAVGRWFSLHTPPLGRRMAEFMALVGSTPWLTAVVIGVGLVLLTSRRWPLLLAWLAAPSGSGLIGGALKETVGRGRPLGAEMLFHGGSPSFPSGHAMSSLVVFWMLAWLLIPLWIERPAARVASLAMAGALVLAIGASRIALGVHHASDVLGGFAAGAVWLGSCLAGVRKALRSA